MLDKNFQKRLFNVNLKKTACFYYRKLNSEYLITNDVGFYCFLSAQSFRDFLSGKIQQSRPEKFSELKIKGFVRDCLDFDSLKARYASKNCFLASGTSLHILVVTLRCDHTCIYCQSGTKPIKEIKYDMDSKTALKIVERIFESPNQDLCIEFQGGEPLLNWKIVQQIVKEAIRINRRQRRNILFSLVSNFSYLDEDKVNFILKNRITLCTSLDGPEELHRKNRKSILVKNNYQNIVKWLRIIRKKIRAKKTYPFKINALTTITKTSLDFPKKIVDEYIKHGFQSIFLRPVSPYGLGLKQWGTVGYPAKKFIDFYKTAFDYILELNKKGMLFSEKTAIIFLTKILTDKDPNYLDLRSPCGAGIGQLAYHYNGDVYLCDEARMLATHGDISFQVGNVFSGTWNSYIKNDATHAVMVSSTLDNIPNCNNCVYKPYCGVCPIYNYVTKGSLFNSNPNNDRCLINKGILDLLFKKIKNKENMEVFLSWIKN